MSAMTIFEAVGAANAIVLRRWLSDLHSIFLLTALAAGTFFVISAGGEIGMVVALCLFALIGGMGFPIQRQLLNDAVTDESCRATVLSIEAFVNRAFCAAAVLAIGPYLETGKAMDFLNYIGCSDFSRPLYDRCSDAEI